MTNARRVAASLCGLTLVGLLSMACTQRSTGGGRGGGDDDDDDGSGGCSFDADCSTGEVCDHQTDECSAPPLGCLADCTARDVCGIAAHATVDECITQWCGKSFYGYYAEQYGQGCADAWEALSACTAALSCEQLAEEIDTASCDFRLYCGAESDAKVAACGGCS